MSDRNPNGWEPKNMGNWQAMFEQPRRDGQPPGQSAPPPPAQDDAPGEDDRAPDFTDYRPWIVQRVRSRPALMLELRRYEPRSGLWQGWAMPYHGLYAVEYVGARMLSLDFGARQFVIEGRGLDALARHIQQGTVETVLEYAPQVWAAQPVGAMVAAIKEVRAQDATLR
ncbi:hypothetical protein [Sphingobium lactosutens]|uniref:Uncharacterized protein n=1 Tax=Sphingobium lactosutens DS20 TaxID=1331060 RepID=T0J4R2_9SPHN|nr:hypothetical protein [Sphingobium lactosutens]EQB16949.1 hypothetical protein RLDS_05805 [Sphingobium lactosutens DS20]